MSASNGYLLAQAVHSLSGDTLGIGITDLRTGTLTRLPATAFERGNVDLVWSGDSRRLCWTHPNSTRDGPVVDCAPATGGSVVRVVAPWTTHLASIPNFDQSARFHGLSPDLTRVAYTLPGFQDPDAPQELWTSDLDGSNAVQIGPTASPLGYEWQPDAVYRPLRYAP